MRVMVSAAASPAAASILRHLRKLGHEVIGLDAAAEAEPLGRAFCDIFHISPRADSDEYLAFLCDRLAEVDVFLPFIDEELWAIGQGWQQIPECLANRIAMSDPAVVLECVDKKKFQQLCTEAGLPIAPEVRTAPAFFKPRFGRGGRGVVEVTDDRGFEYLQGRDGIFQKAIRGDEYTVDAIFDRDSNLLAVSPRRRVRATGVSTIGEVAPDAALSKLAEVLGRRWNFRYAINFQVIRDAEGNDWLIELNPRLAGSAIFSAMAGCDPFAATLALSKGERWQGTAPRRLRVWRFWDERVEEQSQ